MRLITQNGTFAEQVSVPNSAFWLISLQGAETLGNVLQRRGTLRHGML
jgi:hypothetical protein